MELFDEGEVTTADQINRPERALQKESVDDFMERNPLAGGGMLVQPGFGGTRQGYATSSVKTKKFKYPVSNQFGTFYSDKKPPIKPPTKKQLEITNKVYGKQYNKTGIELWETIGNKKRSGIREGTVTGETVGMGKIKKNQLSKDEFIKLANKNKGKTFKEFAEILKGYKTRDGKNFTTQNISERLNNYNLKNFFKRDPALGVSDEARQKAFVTRQKNLAMTAPVKAGGTTEFPFHHIRQIGGEVPLTTDDLAIINRRVNSVIGGKYNKALNRTANAITKNLRLALEAMNNKQEGLALDYMKRVDELNESAEKTVNKAIQELPDKFKKYVGFNKFTLPTNEYGLPISNEPLIIKKVGGMPVTKSAMPLTDLTLDQEKILKKTVRKQAEKGQVGPIKNIEKLLASFSANPKCRANFSKGGRIGYATGPANLSECAISGRNRLEKVIKGGVKLGKQEGVLATQILKAGRSLGSAFTLSGLFGPAALAFTAAAEAGFIGYDMLTTGKTFKETIGDSLLNYALGEKTKIDPQKELFKRFSGLGYNDDQINKFANVLNQTNTLNTILKQDLKVGNLKDQVKAFREQPRDQFVGPDDEMLQGDTAMRTRQSLEDEQQKLDNLLINYRSKPPVGLNMEDTILEDMASGKFQETQQDLGAANIFADLQKEQTARDNLLRFIRGDVSRQAREDRMVGLEQDYLNLLKERGPELTPFAGGGIAKLAGIDEGPQTVSMNPDSQGLPGLLKRARNI